MSTVDGFSVDVSFAVRLPATRRASLRDLLSLTKMGITVANLMSTFAGMWVGSHGHLAFLSTVATLAGTALIVASGAALNNYVDADIDGSMQRTKKRAVASGTVDPDTAMAFGLTLGSAGILVLIFFVNLTAALCGFVGLLFYAYVYSVWLKRTTTLNTVLGGIAGAMPPLLGWAGGSGGTLDFSAWAMFFTFFLWQPPHFLPLAMKKMEEYRAAGIPMLPVVRGFTATKWQIIRYTAAMVPVSMLLGLTHTEGPVYWIGMLVLGLIFLVRASQGFTTKDDLAWANRLFRFSLLYLLAMCALLIIGTFPVHL